MKNSRKRRKKIKGNKQYTRIQYLQHFLLNENKTYALKKRELNYNGEEERNSWLKIEHT